MDFKNISINRTSEFIKQANSDIDKIATAAFGALMLAYLDVNKSHIVIDRARSIFSIFNKFYNVTSSKTTSTPGTN